MYSLFLYLRQWLQSMLSNLMTEVNQQRQMFAVLGFVLLVVITIAVMNLINAALIREGFEPVSAVYYFAITTVLLLFPMTMWSIDLEVRLSISSYIVLYLVYTLGSSYLLTVFTNAWYAEAALVAHLDFRAVLVAYTILSGWLLAIMGILPEYLKQFDSVV